MGPIAAAAIIGGSTIASSLLGGKNAKRALRLQEQALAEFQRIQTPDVQGMKYQLEELVAQGVMTPEDAQAFLMDPTAFESISVAPQYRQAQERALSELQNIYDQGGMTDIDRARVAEIQDQFSTQERGAREAIIQNAAERGVGGSGLELAAQLANQQTSAQRAHLSGLQVAAEAQKRAMDALMKSGDLGGQMQSQAFGEQAQIAAAKDAASKFNASQSQDTQMANVAARNEAQARNLAERQRIADMNAMNRTEQSKYNANLAQVDYENKLKRAAGMSGQLGNVASAKAAQPDFWSETFPKLMLMGGQMYNQYGKKPAQGG